MRYHYDVQIEVNQSQTLQLATWYFGNSNDVLDILSKMPNIIDPTTPYYGALRATVITDFELKVNE